MSPLTANTAAPSASSAAQWQPPTGPGTSAAGDFASLLFAAQGASPTATSPAAANGASNADSEPTSDGSGGGAGPAPAHGALRADAEMPQDDGTAEDDPSTVDGDALDPGLLNWLVQPTLLMPTAAPVTATPAATIGSDDPSSPAGLTPAGASAGWIPGSSTLTGEPAGAPADAALAAGDDTGANPYIGIVSNGLLSNPARPSSLPAGPLQGLPPTGSGSTSGAEAQDPAAAGSHPAQGHLVPVPTSDAVEHEGATAPADTRRSPAARTSALRDRQALPGSEARLLHARSTQAPESEPAAPGLQSPSPAQPGLTPTPPLATEAPTTVASPAGLQAPAADPQAAAPMLAGPSGTSSSDQASASPTRPAAQMQLSTPVDSPEFAPALGIQLRTLVRNGIEHAHVELHPADMGPISVRIALDGSGARVDFTADVAATRQALEAALPTLAGALRESGLTLTGGGVFQQSPQAQSQADGQPGGQGQGQAPRDGHARDSALDASAIRSAALRQAPRGLVDLVA